MIIAETDRESSYTIRIPKGEIQACILFKSYRILIFDQSWTTAYAACK